MDMDFEVNMNEYLPLRDVVFNTLRKAILRGELKPGERLMEIQLANKLGVSRTPIRERSGSDDSAKRGRSGTDHREEYAGCAGSQKGTGRAFRTACV